MYFVTKNCLVWFETGLPIFAYKGRGGSKNLKILAYGRAHTKKIVVEIQRFLKIKDRSLIFKNL